MAHKNRKKDTLRLTKLVVAESNSSKNVGGRNVFEIEQFLDAVDPRSHLEVDVGENEVRTVGSGAVPAKLSRVDDVSWASVSGVDERDDRQSCWQGNGILIVA